MAKGLSKRFAGSVVVCLKRTKLTKTQVVFLNKGGKKIFKSICFLKDVSDLIKKNMQLFLVDDVVTSGATLRKKAKVLKKAGFKKVWGVTLAHGE